MKKQTKPVVEEFDAEERAKFLEQAVVGLIDSGQFRFAYGFGRLDLRQFPPCGCAIGALATFVGADNTVSIYNTIESTGLVTSEELIAFEQGYEFGRNSVNRNAQTSHLNPETHCGPFFEAGCRLRDRPDAAPYWNPKT